MTEDLKTARSLTDLQDEYEQTAFHLITAVGKGAIKEDIGLLKRKLESLAAKIRAMDVNRRL